MFQRCAVCGVLFQGHVDIRYSDIDRGEPVCKIAGGRANDGASEASEHGDGLGREVLLAGVWRFAGLGGILVND